MAFKDYRRFKTPFYKVKIGDSTGKNMIDLPDSIAKLIEKVEIMESFIDNFPTLTLTFIEGSREPASTTPSNGQKGLYPLDSSVASTITNRTGSVVDLKFGGKTGITFYTKEEIASKPTNTTIVSTGNQTKISHTASITNPKFLFQSGNQIQVTWGYKEDPTTIRSFRAYIITLRTVFPDSGQPTTTIVAQQTRASLDKLCPSQGVPFGNKITTGTGNYEVSFNDPQTEDMLRKICSDAGIPCIISNNLPANKLDKDKQKIWVGGESFDQFMVKLAKAHNAYYNVIPNPETGVDTLVFIKKSDFESSLIHDEPNLFYYKYPGSIINSVDIKVDFGPIPTQTQTGIDSSGNEITQTVTDSHTNTVLFSAEKGKNPDKLLDFDPTNNNAILAPKKISETLLQKNFTGHLENSPVENVKYLQDTASIKADILTRNSVIEMELNTIGFTQLTPGTIEIKGIGERYSGRYRVLTVTHIIDSKGYTCLASATSIALPSGDIANPDAPKATINNEKQNEQLFQPTPDTQVTTGNSIRKQYGKLNQTR